MCSSSGPTSLGLSGLPWLPGSLFTRLGKFSFIICSNKLSISCCCSSPSGTPIIQILERSSWQRGSKVSLHFFEFLFLHSVLVGCLFLPFVPNHYLSPGFLPVTVGSLNILLYFILGILHLFFHFLTKLNQICEHFDYQGFKFSIRQFGYSSSFSFLSEVLHCSFILALFLCLGPLLSCKW